MKKLGEEWKQMTEDEKKKYVDLAADDQKRYEKQTEEFNRLGYFFDKDGVKSSEAAKELKDLPMDTVKPKKAINSLLFYIKHNTEAFRKENPDFKLTEMTKKMSEIFNGLNDEEK